MLTFFNSKFGLALFSALVLTFIPWAYKCYLLDYQTEKQKATENYRIEAELEHRLFYIQEIRNEMEQYERNDAIRAYYGNNEELGTGRYYNFKPAFETLSSYSVLQLTIRYASLNSCIDTESYKKMRNSIDGFRKEFLAKLGGYKNSPLPAQFTTKAQLQLQQLKSNWIALSGEC